MKLCSRSYFILFLIGIVLVPTSAAKSITVQSPSMMHNNNKAESETLNQGDTIEIVSVNSRDDIITYLQGKEIDYERFGDYGDVIAYLKNGKQKDVPVIHRVILWLDYNLTSSSCDIPEMNLFNLTMDIQISNFGYNDMKLTIPIQEILRMFQESANPHSGFITKGDNNPVCDQGNLIDPTGSRVEPIKVEWIEGKVEQKEEDSNIILIIVIIFMVLIIIGTVIFIWTYRKRKKKRVS